MSRAKKIAKNANGIDKNTPKPQIRGSALRFRFLYQLADPVPIITPKIPAKKVIPPNIRPTFL